MRVGNRRKLGLFGLGLLILGASGAAAVPIDVLLVLDNSASMRQNDPQGLMPEVAIAFADRLPADCRLGIVRFDQEVRVVLPLTETGAGFVDTARHSLEEIDYSGRWTDLPSGIERATYELRTQGRPEAEKIVVFLTDGIVDLGNPQEDRAQASWLRDSLAPQAFDLGIRFFGVAFTEAADFRLIQSICQTTRGEYFRVLAAADIGDVFERINTRIEKIRLGPSPPPPPSTSPPSTSSLPPSPKEAAPVRTTWLAGTAFAALIFLVSLVFFLRRRKPADPHRSATLTGIGGVEHSISKDVVTIGRAQSNDIVIDDEDVSQRHAKILRRDGSFFVRDLRSTNGTFLNHRCISSREEMKEVMIRHNDVLAFGGTTFDFQESDLDDRRTRFAGQGASTQNDRVGFTFQSSSNAPETTSHEAGMPETPTVDDEAAVAAASDGTTVPVPRPEPPIPEPEPPRPEPEPLPPVPEPEPEPETPSPPRDGDETGPRKDSTVLKPPCENHPANSASYRCESCGRLGCGFCIKDYAVLEGRDGGSLPFSGKVDSSARTSMLCAACAEKEGLT